MKPQKALCINLTAILTLVLLLVPYGSNEAVAKSTGSTQMTENHNIAKGTSKENNSSNLGGPVSNNREQSLPKGENGKSDKKHADEEKHKNHLYHYHRVKHKSKRVTSFIRLCLKIFVTVSYIILLLCCFINMLHI